jgi:hypothetical protein
MEMATANVTVNGIDITDVRVEPSKPITVTGHVVLDPAAPIVPNRKAMRSALRQASQVQCFYPPPPPAAVRDDLTFEFKASPGLLSSGWRHRQAG